MRHVIQGIMRGELHDVQIAAFLALMRMKGESIHELTTAAHTMREFAHTVDLGKDTCDMVGTGGDGKNLFNISTVSSFVAAAAGIKMAKHGNLSVSSRSGSADLLLEAGFLLDIPDEGLLDCMSQCGIAFLFAPAFHKALQYARTARQQLGIRTLFNVIGPLLNPACAKKQVVGVYAQHLLSPIAHVLANLGSERALVVHSQDGLDEISIAQNTDVVEYRAGTFSTWTINPKDYNCYHERLDEIVVETPMQSLSLAKSVFAGCKGAARDIVLLNAAAAIYCAEGAPCFSDAVTKAAEAIDNGEASAKFSKLLNLSQTYQNQHYE